MYVLKSSQNTTTTVYKPLCTFTDRLPRTSARVPSHRGERGTVWAPEIIVQKREVRAHARYQIGWLSWLCGSLCSRSALCPLALQWAHARARRGPRRMAPVTCHNLRAATFHMPAPVDFAQVQLCSMVRNKWNQSAHHHFAHGCGRQGRAIDY